MKYNDYSFEFCDAHSCLVEFEKDRENLLNPDINTMGIGMAFDEEKVVVVDIFCNRDVIVDSVDINRELFSIVVERMVCTELISEVKCNNYYENGPIDHSHNIPITFLRVHIDRYTAVVCIT